MREQEIKAALDALVEEMLAKDFSGPRSDLTFSSNSERVRIYIAWDDPKNDNAYRFIGSDDARIALEKALQWVSEQQDAKTRDMHAWQADLGRMIDRGREIGVEVNFLNPLIETAKNLAENAITHQPAE